MILAFSTMAGLVGEPLIWAYPQNYLYQISTRATLDAKTTLAA